MTERMPVLFVGHGSPMNALGRTPLAAFLAGWPDSLPEPEAVLVVSAHWYRAPLGVTTSPRPEILYDFGGFPAALYQLDWPAAGDPERAERLVTRLREEGFPAEPDPERGFDHGVWSPLRQMFPRPRRPTVQLSLPLRGHLELGRALRPLRDEGVLIVASGNIVHSLPEVDFARPQAPVPGWASGFDAWVAERLEAADVDGLARWEEAPHARRAHPSPDHFWPLLVAIGAASETPRVSTAFAGFEHGSISLRCLRLD